MSSVFGFFGDCRISASVGRGGRNLRDDVVLVQQLINDNLPIPLPPLAVDGMCGPFMIHAIEEIQRRNLQMNRPDGKVDSGGATFRFLAGNNLIYQMPLPTLNPIAWGAKVSPAFKAKVIKISANLGVDPNFLMAAMAFESGETFSASAKNKDSGATGLIQFMGFTATGLGTTTAALAGMMPENQLDYVEKYFAPYKNKLNSLEDVYMAILWPNAIGKANSHVLFSKPSKEYDLNKSLDADNDGNVTKAEAAAQVRSRLTKGQGAGYAG